MQENLKHGLGKHNNVPATKSTIRVRSSSTKVVTRLSHGKATEDEILMAGYDSLSIKLVPAPCSVPSDITTFLPKNNLIEEDALFSSKRSFKRLGSEIGRSSQTGMIRLQCPKFFKNLSFPKVFQKGSSTVAEPERVTVCVSPSGGTSIPVLDVAPLANSKQTSLVLASMPKERRLTLANMISVNPHGRESSSVIAGGELTCVREGSMESSAAGKVGGLPCHKDT